MLSLNDGIYKGFNASSISEEALRSSDYYKVISDPQKTTKHTAKFIEAYCDTTKTKNCAEDIAVKELIKRTETSFPQLHQILLETSKNSPRQTLTSQLALNVLVPNAGAIELIASKYKKKYNIDIEVSAYKNEPLEAVCAHWFKDVLINEVNDKTPRCKGLIFDPGGKFNHVVPLLFKMENNEASVLVLDVLGKNPNHKATQSILSVLCALKIPFCQCEDQRQADTISCRMGSPITLRNALLSIKDGNPAAFEPFKHCRLHAEGIDEHAASFNMPAEWSGANDQIFRPKGTVEHMMNPRQKHSKRTEKRVESLLESRMRHNQNMPFKFSYDLSLNKDVELNNMELTSGITILKSSDRLFIKWTSTKKVNTYFLMKGEKENAKVEAVKKLLTESGLG